MSDADPDAPQPPMSPAELFDSLADDYDQSGTPFFTPVAALLVQLLEPREGERALDIGCGRGAVTLPLARAVGPSGSVLAVDAAPGMVAQVEAAARAAGLANVTARLADATTLGQGAGRGFDVVASSLVLFFLPQPESVLAGWVNELRPGGRLGITTFGPLDDTTRALDHLFDPWLPQGLLDARRSATSGPFASDQGVLDLFAAAGLEQLVNVVEPVHLHFPDVEAWQRFSMSTGQRGMWMRVPEDRRADLVRRAADLLARAADADGTTLVWNMRYTLGRRPG